MKKNIKFNYKCSILLLVSLFCISLVSCGEDTDSKGNSNIYNHISIKGRTIKGSEEDYTVNKAVALLNAGKVDEAIECLTDFLENNPDSKASKSMLSTAYMQKSGIDLLHIITKIIDRGGVDNSGHYNDLVSVVSGIIGGYDEEVMNYMKEADSLIKNLEATSTLDEYNKLKKMIVNIVILSLNMMSITADFQSGFTEADLDKIDDTFVNNIKEKLVDSKDAIEDMISATSLTEAEVSIIKTEIDKFYDNMMGEENISVDQLKEYIRNNYNVQ